MRDNRQTVYSRFSFLFFAFVWDRTIAATLSSTSEWKNYIDAASMMLMAVWTTYLRIDIEIERAGSGCITIEWIHVSVDVCNKNRHLLISAQKKFFFMDFRKWDKEWPIHEKKKYAAFYCCAMSWCACALNKEYRSRMATGQCKLFRFTFRPYSALSSRCSTHIDSLCKLNAMDRQWSFVHSLNGFKDSISN